MPWVRASLKNVAVYAKADPRGRLLTTGGTVEVRYKTNDGRRYHVRPGALAITDPTPLPDDTCDEAKDVPRAKAAISERKPGRGVRAVAADAGEPISSEAAGGPVAYTDGACSGNPGPAGLGVLIQDGGKRVELSEWLGQGTNNIAELTAVLRALERTDPARPIVVHTDSSYAIGVLTKGWKAKANQALIATIKAAMKGRSVRLVYVKGHAGVPGNERADELARRAVSSRSTTERSA